MNETWKGFFKWLIGLLVAVGGFLFWFFTRRSNSNRSADNINSDADAAVAQTAQDIKADSDEALASRFNKIAQKQERKKDE